MVAIAVLLLCTILMIPVSPATLLIITAIAVIFTYFPPAITGCASCCCPVPAANATLY
jgi:hypothetical protein